MPPKSKDTHTDALINSFEGKTVLIVGDVMVDRYLTGDVDRISPEAPVPVVHLTDSVNRLGGAANVALNIEALGGRPICCSIIGQDEGANILTTLLKKRELSVEGIVGSPDRITTVKTRITAQYQHLLRVDREQTDDISQHQEEQLLGRIERILKKEEIKTVLLQDYNKGVLTERIIKRVLRLAGEQNIPVVVDPKERHFFSYQTVTAFKPNLREVRAQLPFSIEVNIPDLDRASQFLREKLHHQTTYITLGEDGIYLDEGSGRGQIIPTSPRLIADVCGAGDTVVSVLALGLAAQIQHSSIAWLANMAGGQVCEHMGVVAVNKATLVRECRQGKQPEPK